LEWLDSMGQLSLFTVELILDSSLNLAAQTTVGVCSLELFNVLLNLLAQSRVHEEAAADQLIF
jgi:hypothetical protein